MFAFRITTGAVHFKTHHTDEESVHPVSLTKHIRKSTTPLILQYKITKQWSTISIITLTKMRKIVNRIKVNRYTGF